ALALLALSACTHLPVENMIVYQIDRKEPPIIHFEGKGAAAGVMMSSSIGAMGIAIGVAIDEGIANDIRGALENSDCHLPEVIPASFQRSTQKRGFRALVAESTDLKKTAVISIQHVGFKSGSGEESPT